METSDKIEVPNVIGIDDETAVKLYLDFAVEVINPGLEHVDLERIPQDVVDKVWESVKKKYEGRPYHSLRHIRYAIDKTYEVMDDKKYGNVSEFGHSHTTLALIFHDAVMGTDGEEKSYRFFRRSFGKYFPKDGFADYIVKGGIMATKYDVDITLDSESDYYIGMIRDADLCILGEQNHKIYFDWYFEGILEEYGEIDNHVFAKGRKEFMEKLLALPQIYCNRPFGVKYEWYTRETCLSEIRVWSTISKLDGE